MHTIRPTALVGALLLGCASPPADYAPALSAWHEQHEARSSAAPDDELATRADLPSLIAYARLANPGLEAAFQRWKAALERVPQAGALPAPRLSFGAFLAEVETRVGPMDARISFTQPFPWFGERDLAARVAFAHAEAQRAKLSEALLELEARVRKAWYEYAWLEHALLVTRGNRELLVHWESVARARFEAGIGSHTDVIRAQVELGKLEDRLRGLEDLAGPLVADLNAALGRPAAATLAKPPRELPTPPAVDAEQLTLDLAASSPALAALRLRVDAARLEHELAGKAFYPDFSLGVDYTFIGSAENPSVSGSGDDALALTLGVELPVWRAAYRAGERGAEALLIAAQRDLDEAENRLQAELALALYRFRDAHRRSLLFEGSLVPKGEEAVQSLDVAYQAGDSSFLELIDAQRLLLEFQLEVARAEVDRAQAAAELERITGTPLNEESR